MEFIPFMPSKADVAVNVSVESLIPGHISITLKNDQICNVICPKDIFNRQSHICVPESNTNMSMTDTIKGSLSI